MAKPCQARNVYLFLSEQLGLRLDFLVRQLLTHVNLTKLFGDRSGRACLSESAGPASVSDAILC